MEVSEAPFVRVLVCSTPRSGSTWARSLLAATYELTEIPVHHPDDVPWDALPQRCVIQLHWHPTERLLELLARHGIQVICMLRHPLDVLVSILHFVLDAPETGRWLAGEGGGEAPIVGVGPTSPEFLAYATGPRARALLSLGPEWVTVPGVIPVRYETLADDPPAVLDSVVAALEPAPLQRVEASIETSTLDRLRRRHTTRQFHFWQGRPGLWKRLVTTDRAQAIAAAYPAPFEALGYDCEPDASLDEVGAELNWLRLEVATLRAEIRQAGSD